MSQNTNQVQTLYERLGGASAVNAAVDIFYQRVLADKTISHFFASIDMNEQRAKQKAFLTFVFGGPLTYSGKDLRTAHAPLVSRGLNGAHFDAVVSHLKATLEQLHVGEALVDEVARVAESTRKVVLGL